MSMSPGGHGNSTRLVRAPLSSPYVICLAKRWKSGRSSTSTGLRLMHDNNQVASPMGEETLGVLLCVFVPQANIGKSLSLQFKDDRIDK